MIAPHFKMGPVLALLTVLLAPALIPAVVLAKPAPSPSTESATPQAQARHLLDQGAQQFQAGQPRAALASWEQALGLYRQVGDRQGEARVVGNLGAAYGALGNFEQALTYYHQSLSLSEDLNDTQGIRYALGNLGFTYHALGQYRDAITYHEQDLALARAVQDRAGEHYALNNLGISYKALGDYDRAVDLFQQSLTLARQIGDRSGEANATGNLGNVYAEQGHYAQALTTYDQTLRLLQTLGDRRGEGILLERIGNVYTALGNPERATVYYQRSLTLARARSDRSREATVLGNLGIIARHQGHSAQGIEYLQQALTLFRQLGDRQSEAAALNSLGNTYIENQDYVRAESYYRQSLAIAHDIGDRRSEGMALGNLGQTNDLLERDAEAVELLQQSLAIAREVGDRLMEGQALHSLGIVQFELGKGEEAANTLQAAIHVWESLRPGLSDDNQVSLFETQAETYRLLQKVLIHLNRTDEALEISERGRARTFVELMAARLPSSVDQAASPTSPSPEPITLVQMQEVARTQTATLVEYSITGASELSIWVIHPDGTIDFRQTTLAQVSASINQVAEQTRVAAALGRGGTTSEAGVTALVQQTRRDLGAGNLDAPSPLRTSSDRLEENSRRLSRQLRNLHQLLIEPIVDLLPTEPTAPIVFIPQGALFLVPFAALQDASGQYLIERHTILTAPAIQVLQLAHQKQQSLSPESGSSTLIVGNPAMPSLGNPPTPLSPLPNAEEEARFIASLFNTQAITGSQATEETVVQQMTRSRLIHLATHGLLNDFSGLGTPGAIALTPTTTEDGFLTANEILRLPLNADLVVLSACDTGRGRITGDGVIGLSRSLISAGAANVIVSLWAVPDAPTAFLMSEFYRQLQHNPDKGQALRQAMLHTLQHYPSSSDWAAFTLIGATE